MPEVDDKNMEKAEKIKIARMSERTERKMFLLYPEDKEKSYWDIYITIVLLVSCILTPYRIAFGGNDTPLEWKFIEYYIDFSFLVDMFIIANSAFYNAEFQIVEDRKEIGIDYLKSWFFIDLLSIFPFEWFMSTDSYGKGARLSLIHI